MLLYGHEETQLASYFGGSTMTFPHANGLAVQSRSNLQPQIKL